MSELSFEYKLFVEPEHIDELNHVNNVVYVQWIQDAAVKHWNHVAPADIREEFVWFIVRHEIDYKASAKPGDELLIRTFVLNASVVSSDRRVQIYRASDMQLLVESKTTWCLINKQTQRPARITDSIKALFLPL
ncbi:MAG: acyl-CoA thioesterase [Bacteroidales bacterium]